MGRDEKKHRKMLEEFGRGHEERKLRRRAAKERRGARRKGREREPDWRRLGDEDEDGGPEREPMRPRGTEGLDRWVERVAGRDDAGSAGGAEAGSAAPGAVVCRVDRGRCRVRDEQDEHELEVPHGIQVAVGDEVRFDGARGRVTERLPRRSHLGRPDPGDPRRELVLCANVDVVCVVGSARTPPLRTGLVDRVWIAADRGGAETLLCVNKVDLLDDHGRRELELTVLAPYVELGLTVVLTSASTGLGVGDLRGRLAGRTAALVGHSGVGKSSLLNALCPGLALATGAVSEAHGKGRHTTTAAELVEHAGGLRLIDTPGVRAFGLEGLGPREIAGLFRDFEPYAGACRFDDCSHTHEPDCAVKHAVEEGGIARPRYAAYLRIGERRG